MHSDYVTIKDFLDSSKNIPMTGGIHMANCIINFAKDGAQSGIFNNSMVHDRVCRRSPDVTWFSISHGDQ